MGSGSFTTGPKVYTRGRYICSKYVFCSNHVYIQASNYRGWGYTSISHGEIRTAGSYMYTSLQTCTVTDRYTSISHGEIRTTDSYM